MPTFHPHDRLEMTLAELAASEVKHSWEIPSDAFLERARQAARRAECVRRLCAGAAELGFQALPLPDYLAALAVRAEVHLASAVAPVGKARSPVSVWVRLAARVGLEAERIKLHLRLWMAEQTQILPAAGFARGEAGTSGIREPRLGIHANASKLADMLTVREESYGVDTRAELAAWLAEVDEATR